MKTCLPNQIVPASFGHIISIFKTFKSFLAIGYQGIYFEERLTDDKIKVPAS